MQSNESTYDFNLDIQNRNLNLDPISLSTLQMNITKLCNQSCVHCHVDASPRRKESMNDQVMDRCIELIEQESSITTVDITGGAPELHPRFMDLVKQSRLSEKQVIVRHNLTVSMDPHPNTKSSMEYLPEFFAEQRVQVVSSLPYYQEFFTDKQRGCGVFKKSIESLRRLNKLGFGRPSRGLELHLVYNPVGAFLPAAQVQLERDYKNSLLKEFGIEFNQLFVITNLPIHRFKAQLIVHKQYGAYMHKLFSAFNPDAAKNVMCRNLISVGYDGKLYDCDFNQMLEMPIKCDGKTMDVFSFDSNLLLKRKILFKEHCYGCTAGSGSSCGGQTV